MGSNEQRAHLLALGETIQTPEGMVDTAEKLLRVRNREGDLIPLRANPAQWAFERNRGQHNIILKARQMGMTTWIAARFFLMTITRPGTLTVQVAQTQNAVEAIFQIVQRMWANLPDDLRKGLCRRSRANVGQMTFPELDSEFRVWSAGDRNAGRGLSIRNLHCSELSRWPLDAAGTLAGLRAALAPSGELIMESTPNGAAGAFYTEWQRARHGTSLPAQHRAGDVVRHFFPWWLEPAYQASAIDESTLTDEEHVLRSSRGLTLQQLSFRRNLARNFGAMRVQEFAEDPETCFRTSGDSCFERDAIDDRLVALADRQPVEVRRNGALRIWLPPSAGRHYIVAVDPAGGAPDGDFVAMQVIDAVTGMQCAELQERINVLETALVAAALAREYSDALLVIERNNHGCGVLGHLEHGSASCNLYHDRNGVPGWLTTSVSKQEMIGTLGAQLVESAHLFQSSPLLQECRTFVRGRTGAGGAAPGAHDDLVMAMAIAQNVRRYQRDWQSFVALENNRKRVRGISANPTG